MGTDSFVSETAALTAEVRNDGSAEQRKCGTAEVRNSGSAERPSTQMRTETGHAARAPTQITQMTSTARLATSRDLKLNNLGKPMRREVVPLSRVRCEETSMPGYAHLRRPRSGRICAPLRRSAVPHFRRSALPSFRTSVVPHFRRSNHTQLPRPYVVGRNTETPVRCIRHPFAAPRCRRAA